ncbi:MAG: signal peptidase II [Candidatus Moraniibacteriota bacterium]
MELSPKAWLAVGGVFFLVSLDFFLRMHVSLRACNEGIAFGVSVPKPVIILLAIFLIFFFFRNWKDEADHSLAFGYLLLVTGGGLNLLDRIVSGCVRDYLFLPFLPLFPSFNLADMMLVLGVGVIARAIFRRTS